MLYYIMKTVLFLFLSYFFGAAYAGNCSVNFCINGQSDCWNLGCVCDNQSLSPACVIEMCDQNILCENGGLCVSNKCYCTDNFYGDMCQFFASRISRTERPDLTANSTAELPTGFLGLEIGYPLYLSLAIPSAVLSAFFVCHLCLFCCIPGMWICRRKGERLTTKGMHDTVTSNHQTFQIETPLTGSRANLNNNLDNRQESMPHDYLYINSEHINAPPNPATYENIPNNARSAPNRPLPPPPAWSPEMIKVLPPAAPPSARTSEMDPYATFCNTRTFPRSNVRSGYEDGNRGSGYTAMDPKYVVQNDEVLV